MSATASFRRRVAGKWQLPLFGLSLVCLAASLLVSAPEPPPTPVAELVAQVSELTSTGAFGHALELADRVRARKDCDDASKAQTHLWSARAVFGQALRKGLKSSSITKQVTDHYRAAEGGGVELEASDVENLGTAAEWRQQFLAAVELYERALGMGLAGGDELRRHVFDLRRDRLKEENEALSGWLGGFLAAVSQERADLRFWGVEEQLGLLYALGRAGDASTLLASEAERFSGSDFAERFAYLECVNLVALKRFDEAETRLRGLRQQVDRDGELNARTGWLLGRVLLDDGGPHRPMEGISFFEDVIRTHPRGEYTTASRVGLAEGLAVLDRHAEAIAGFEQVVEELPGVASRRLIDSAALAATLFVTAEARRVDRQVDAALGYARLATRVVDKGLVEPASAMFRLYADLAVQAGEALRSSAGGTVPPEAGAMFEQAAEAYLEVARISFANEARASDASWQAAEACARAGLTDRAVGLFERFTADRPSDRLVPRAWLRMGQLRHEARQLQAAVSAYQECYKRFPGTLEGARALVPSARCLVSMGGENVQAAERTLQTILSGAEVFTPDAPEFADAMFLLGDVRLRLENFEGSISTLEEALDRYPSDPRTVMSRFLLADAYRRSGLALRAEAKEAAFDAELVQIRAESARRLAKARELYREVVDEYADRAMSELSPMERMGLRHAHLYEADCYFDTQDYARALKLYEEAAGIYKDQPGGLAAYVQIINCHVFLGQADEARAALARATVLVEAIPDAAFVNGISPQTRGDWKEYFVWLGESGLF